MFTKMKKWINRNIPNILIAMSILASIIIPLAILPTIGLINMQTYLVIGLVICVFSHIIALLLFFV